MTAILYSLEEEPTLPLSFGHEKLIELDGDYMPVHELPAEDVNSSLQQRIQQRPGKKAPRPNKASRAFRHAQLAVRSFIQRRRRRVYVAPRHNDVDDRLPLSVIELLLTQLSIRAPARNKEGDEDFVGARSPARPCPTSADQLYDRLVYSRDVARRRKCHHPAARHELAYCVTWAELPWLLEPVLAEMKACLDYMETFRGRLNLETEGCDYWLDMSHLRRCIFRLMGFWPHDIEHDLEAWAFGLPEDLTRLLYPQCGRFDHEEMAFNLDEVIIGPVWDRLFKLENIVRLHQHY
ncbi:hypothetical protein F5883DRAFT_187039 [Diaporthe sp. PMI_573]|nr:hypothetical protein F5883DRAFT_187039 [Diaporthaceae sp. PMI_573]